MVIIATLVIALAAALHVGLFVLQSITWSRPGVWRRFGVPDRAAAESTRAIAYMQGFYHLFLAIAAIVGVLLFGLGSHTAGLTLVVFALLCMVLAAVVRMTAGAGYWKGAILQGVLPLAGLVLMLFAG